MCMELKKGFMLFCAPSSMQAAFGLRDNTCVHLVVTIRNDGGAADNQE